jgi:hypothetical protein
MSEKLLKKKEIQEQVPVFSHEERDISDAIGIPGLVESLSKKMKILSTNQEITSPSRAMQYFYSNFNKAELAFIAMHNLGGNLTKDLDVVNPEEEVE